MTSTPLFEASIRMLSSAALCPENDGFKNTAMQVVPAIASSNSSKALTPNSGFTVRHPSEVAAWLRKSLHDP